MDKEMIVVSACLTGQKCRYDGKDYRDDKVLEYVKDMRVLEVCPEVLGGLSVPRPATELDGSGELVLEGSASAVTNDGDDITPAFVQGALETLKMTLAFGATRAILKSKSPSCGCGKTYDGTFTSRLVDGDGVTTALLKKNGIDVKTEDDI